ncbi:MAG: RraA family protein [Anaerolineae bacterium]
MHIQPSREHLIALTNLCPFERFDDGRPKVPDDLLERMKLVTTEEAWVVLHKHGYDRQFEGNWIQTHPGKILVGRAVTTAFVPHRPDFHNSIQKAGEDEGRDKIGGQNNWVIKILGDNDCLVTDLFGKIRDGTMIGDNLGTAIDAQTGAGAVIHGGIRDFTGLVELENSNFFIRGMDPTAIAEVTLTGINIPIRIGGATVLPGDVVLGTPTGTIFIPSHLAQEVVETSENIRVRDEFGKLRLSQGKYTSADIDVEDWREDIEADYQEWLKGK